MGNALTALMSGAAKHISLRVLRTLRWRASHNGGSGDGADDDDDDTVENDHDGLQSFWRQALDGGGNKSSRHHHDLAITPQELRESLVVAFKRS
jgi:hypothetical protein